MSYFHLLISLTGPLALVVSLGDVSIEPGLHISRKDCKHRLENMFFEPWLGLHMVVMIIFARANFPDSHLTN